MCLKISNVEKTLSAAQSNTAVGVGQKAVQLL